MLHRECEVRVLQARLARKRSGHEYATIGRNSNRGLSLSVLVSYDGTHAATEACRDTESPSWQRLAIFQLNLDERFEGEGKPLGEMMERGSALAASQKAIADDGRGPANVTPRVNPRGQSLNPFAENFVPAPSPTSPRPPPPPPRPTQPRLRTSLIVYLRVLSDNLISKELVGEVAVDLMTLLRSDGDHLATDRLGHVGKIPPQPLPDQEILAVDTWVALRERSGELRLQILVRRGSSDRIIDARRRISVDLGRSMEAERAPGASVGVKSPKGGTCLETQADTYRCAWPEFEKMLRDGLVKTSLGAGQRSLNECLLEVQEQYDFSAADGYRQGRPEEVGDHLAGRQGGDRRHGGTPDWPKRNQDVVWLRSCMQLAALRDRFQCIAWAEKLQSSPSLQYALRSPPAFGLLRIKPDARWTRTQKPTAEGLNQFAGELADLVSRGIPTALQHRTAAMFPNRIEDKEMGIAFEGTDEELGGLGDVTTAIPRVEVIRVLGSICCAEYHLQVKREVTGDSWFVIRRYSDFLAFYSNLPRSFIAIAPPLPPKSWRSLSFLSMTPAFLEDRRVALEVALRRLTINAVRADAVVQADLRAFLGFPPCAAGVDAEVVRHLVRVPSDLELALSSRIISPPPLLSAFRVTLWMLFSGAAYKCSVTEDREQYLALVAVRDENDWCSGGGHPEDFAQAKGAFQTIDEDVNRTNFGDSTERERVRRLLRAFALKNPSTGYCQGMNSVALFLLRTTKREDIAFWLLDALATAVIPGHWEKLYHISEADAEAVTIRKLLREHVPRLLEHLDTRGLPPEVLACDFMLSLGCRALPPTTVLRCWDLLFLEGGDILQYVMLAVLRFAEDDLLDVQGASATSERLATRTAALHDADSLIEMILADTANSRESAASDRSETIFDAKRDAGRPP